ncbi:tetratricopeptide repeat protein [Trichormus azollae HNT15244]
MRRYFKPSTTEEAKELFSEVISRSPKDPDAYLRLANILLLQNNQQEAVNNLQKSRKSKYLFVFQKQRQASEKRNHR